MRPLRTFTIEPSLPTELVPLLEIAHNLWWSWHGDAVGLFRRLAPEEWEALYHNPVAMLGRADQERLARMAHQQVQQPEFEVGEPGGRSAFEDHQPAGRVQA